METKKTRSTICRVPLFLPSAGLTYGNEHFKHGLVRENTLQNAFRETIQSGGRRVCLKDHILYRNNDKVRAQESSKYIAFGKKMTADEAISHVSDERLQNWLATQNIVVYNSRLDDFTPWSGEIVIPEPIVFLPELPNVEPIGNPVVSDIFVTMVDQNGKEFAYRTGPRTFEDAVRTLCCNHSFTGFYLSFLHYYENGAIIIEKDKKLICRREGNINAYFEASGSILQKWARKIFI